MTSSITCASAWRRYDVPMSLLKTAIVTGATGAIGPAIALGIARQHDYRVALVCRDIAKGEEVAARIRAASENDEVWVEHVDLASRASINALRDRWKGPLHLLVNDAAIAPRRRETTDEGIERQLAVNVLGYTRMTDAFTDLLATEAGRVVNVASYWAGGLDIDDLQFERRRYDNDAAYRQSKQANRMLTVAYARRLADRGISVNACHPGDVNSTLSNSLGFGGHESPEQGAATPLLLALEPIGGEHSGCYFAGGRASTCEFARDERAIEILYEACRAFG